MITINKDFIESMPIALILTDSKGIILKMNNYAISILKNMGFSSITSIHEIDSKFDTKALHDRHQFHWTHSIGGSMIDINVYKVKYEENNSCYLYVFDDAKYKIKEMNMIFDSIDDSVIVINKNRIVEKANGAFMRITEADRKLYIGKSIYEILNEKYLEDSVSLKVFESKKSVSMNVKYKNGTILTFTGKPIYDKDGEVSKVISTGRDITALVKLEEKLKKTEEQKEKYFLKLKELEEYLGANEVIYSSDKMKQLLNIAIKAAKKDSSIFIWGESGVGKEVMARLIHNTSRRKNKPFIAINCAAIPNELLESEFFGYEEGAFTGAKKHGKKGLFEEANGGTIFLDEIGELPLKMQSKLLRVIQENGFMRVGGREFIPIDVRYITATNLTKEQLSDHKRFRQDLYFRLGVIPINIPPLRERKEDIFPLVQYFLKHFNNKYNSRVRISNRVMKYMYRYDWPGNVRELKNIIERLVVLAESDVITHEEYEMVSQFGVDNDNKDNSSELLNNKLMPLKEAHKILEENMIKKALQEEPNIVKAAELLGIAPSTIYRKIKKGEINIE